MQRMASDNQKPLPNPLQSTRSFSRFEPPPPNSSAPSGPDTQEAKPGSPNITEPPERSHSDVFESQEDEETSPTTADPEGDGAQPEDFSNLPVELQSLVERFLESLSAKSRDAPIAIDRFSELYQNFYLHVDTQIATHIAALSTKINRERSPTPSVSSTGSGNTSRGGSRMRGTDPETQMLTASEVLDRKKTRRQLEARRIAMEEAVERSVCEKVYPRLWRHGSTDDEERDAKLRSRAAALSLVGVDLKELLTTASSEGAKANLPETKDADTADNMRQQLAEARSNLEAMNAERYPLGKLQHLTKTHKSIVDFLSHMFPSSSSADEILPTLIYVIITSSPDSVHVVSNLLFIQRFRAISRLDGEASYCLTNLEATIAFLETVDLSSIRPDEQLDGTHKGSTGRPLSAGPPASPSKTPTTPMFRGLPSSPQDNATLGESTVQKHSRRLSNLISRPKPIDVGASTAADTAMDTIHSALDGSFKFLFGRIKEKQALPSPVGSPEVAAPKTLEDARKLVSPKLESDEPPAVNPTDRVMELVGGRRAVTRETSSDSVRSGASTKRVSFADGSPPTVPSGQPTAPFSANHQAFGVNAVESMRTFGGNSLNALKGFSMRGFSRQPSPAVVTPNSAPSDTTEQRAAAHVDTMAAALREKEMPLTPAVDPNGIAPPLTRFVDCHDARELNFYDVEVLLRDYQRLAGALRVLQS